MICPSFLSVFGFFSCVGLCLVFVTELHWIGVIWAFKWIIFIIFLVTYLRHFLTFGSALYTGSFKSFEFGILEGFSCSVHNLYYCRFLPLALNY